MKKTENDGVLKHAFSLALDGIDPTMAVVHMSMRMPLSTAASIAQLISASSVSGVNVEHQVQTASVEEVKKISERRFRGRDPISESISWVWVFGGMRLQSMGAAWIFEVPESRDNNTEIYLAVKDGKAIAVLLLAKALDPNKVMERSRLYRCPEHMLTRTAWEEAIEPALYNLIHDHLSGDGEELMPDEEEILKRMIVHLVDNPTMFPAQV